MRRDEVEYLTWLGMKKRCYKETNKSFKRYGARGIKVCDRWLNKDGYKNFLEDMGRRPEGLSLDRTDNDKGYSPSNCRWATAKQQANNRSSNVLLEVDGKVLSISQWADTVGTTRQIIGARLRKNWDVRKAIFTPKRGSAALNVGSIHGKWCILNETKRDYKRSKRAYICRCVCGNTSVVDSYDLRVGKSIQCRSCSSLGNTYAKK